MMKPAMQSTRRNFLRSAALSAAALAARPALTLGADDPPPPPKYKIGTQLYSWAAFYERNQQSVTDHLDDVMAAARDCGYDYLECPLNVENPEKNTDLAWKLKAKGFALTSIYLSGTFHETATAVANVYRYLEAAKAAYEAGFTILTCSPKSIGRDKKPAELSTQVTALRRLGEGMAKFGMRLAIHNQPTDARRGGWEYQYNFRQSPGKVVGFCLDVGTLFKGGVLPMDALKENSSRLVSWHLRQCREGVWLEELTQGDIDYEAVIAHAKQYRLPPLYTVALQLDKETKVTRSVIENHKRSRAYLKALLDA
jgi:sugar phosphate isomerase/epimerase